MFLAIIKMSTILRARPKPPPRDKYGTQKYGGDTRLFVEVKAAKQSIVTVLIIVLIIMLGFLTYDGKNKASMCLKKTLSVADKEILQRNKRVNDVVFGVAIGMFAHLALSMRVMTSENLLMYALIVMIISSISINSYTKIGECEDDDKIDTQKSTMYTILGGSIGVFAYALITQLMKRMQKQGSQARVIAMVMCIVVIVISSFNLTTSKKCESMDEADKKKLDGFQQANIAYVAIASVSLIGLVGSVFYKGRGSGAVKTKFDGTNTQAQGGADELV